MSGFNFEKKVARPRQEETVNSSEAAEVKYTPEFIDAVLFGPEVKPQTTEPIMHFVPGTAIYQLVTERLDVLEKTITNATKEYEELSKYIKGEE